MTGFPNTDPYGNMLPSGKAMLAAAEAKGYKAGLEKAAEVADYQAVAYQAAGMPRLNGALGLFANSLRAIAEKG